MIDRKLILNIALGILAARVIQALVMWVLRVVGQG
jgi:hypothetical protein